MDYSKYYFSGRLFLQGAAATILLSISPFGIPSSSNILAIRIWPSSAYTRVTLESNIAFKYRQFSLTFPDRIVVDLKKIQLNNTLKSIGKQISSFDPYLKLIKVGQFDQKNVRLVFKVKTHVNPKIFVISPISGFKHRLVIDFYPTSNIHTNDDPLLALLEDNNKGKLGNVLPIQEKKSDKLRRNRPIIMIDPGHGGEDPGAIGKYKTREKDIVLQIARRLKKLINYESKMKVYMTRNEDIFIPLKVRVAKARKIQADLFISIHADSFTNRKARGSSIFTLSIKKTPSSNIAHYLTKTQNEVDMIAGISKSGDKYLDHTIFDLVQTVTINNSLKFGREVLKRMSNVNKLHKNIVDQAGFIILKAPDIPSILVETAFISNIKEEQKLKTEKFQQQMAESIYLGIKSYFYNGGKRTLR
ncbi:MAG: N-acetylmuramoyl-L-alanine amidase [Arsenophonus sp.]